jgi:hypothetical protein
MDKLADLAPCLVFFQATLVSFPGSAGSAWERTVPEAPPLPLFSRSPGSAWERTVLEAPPLFTSSLLHFFSSSLGNGHPAGTASSCSCSSAKAWKTTL